jgi:hypothetical protein
MKVSEIRKAIVAGLAVVVAAGNAAITALNDEAISNQDVATIVVAALIALGVYVVPNDKPVV